MPVGKSEMRVERALSAGARRVEPVVGRLFSQRHIRRVLHARARRAWGGTKSPLIVCYGNINRSPFAEGLARRQPGSEASSAGLYHKAGRSSPPLTVTVAAARGVDLSAHRSVLLDEKLLDSASTVFIFDLDNLARIAARHPAALRKTYFLGALADSGDVLIADPHGCDETVLDEVLARIEQAIDCAEDGRE
jgi:protein-tyrosine phosphatase